MLEDEDVAASAPGRIDRLRLMKELEPLQSAWDIYASTKQVRPTLTCRLSCISL